MSVELPPSIRTFMMSQLVMLTIIIIRLSCSGLTPAKSTSVNVIGGIELLELAAEMWLTLLMAHKCLFRVDLVLPCQRSHLQWC